MTKYLPPNLLALFTAREPLPFFPPCEKPATYRKQPYTGIADFVKQFEQGPAPPPPPPPETPADRRERRRREKAESNEFKIEQALAGWDPNTNEEATNDPFKTLFVGRLSFETSETKLRREFEASGKVKQVKLVVDKKSSKPRGYAFVEYEHERDMFDALRKLNGKKVDDRRILVDVERGRTVRGWRPRRLGGGMAGRISKQKNSGAGERRAEPRGRSRSRSPVVRKRSRSRERERRRSHSRSKDRVRRSRSGDRERRDRDRRDRGRDHDRDRDRKERDRKDRGDRRDVGMAPRMAPYPSSGYEYEDGEYYE